MSANMPGAQGYGQGAPRPPRTGGNAGSGSGGGMKTALLIGCIAVACVSIPIIGILAAIAIPNFMKFQCKSKQAEAKTNLSGLYTAERAFYGEYNFYTSDLKSLNWQPDGEPSYVYGFAYPGPEDLRDSDAAPAGHDIDRADTTHAEILALGSYRKTKMVTSYGTPLTSSDLPEDTWVERDRFLAGAVGNVDGDADLDIWTMSELRALNVVSNDCSP